MDLSDTVLEMTELLKSVISKKAVIKYQFDTKIPHVSADPTQLRQVFMNLVTNASDSLEGRDGTIGISTGQTYLDAALPGDFYMAENIVPGHYVYFQVDDTGCGIDDATRRRIFEPFFTTKSKGRGLGLAALLGIVKAHRGALHLRTAPGRGATFTVYLPLNTARAAPDRHDQQTLQRNAWSGLVLVVDDEEAVLSVARGTLERMGFTVPDGTAGLRIFAERQDDLSLIVLDVMMPGLPGEQVYRAVVESKPDIHVLFSSGYHDLDGHEQRTLRTDFIQKPYRPADLQRKLAELLAR